MKNQAEKPRIASEEGTGQLERRTEDIEPNCRADWNTEVLHGIYVIGNNGKETFGSGLASGFGPWKVLLSVWLHSPQIF